MLPDMRPLSVLGMVSYRVFPAQMGGQKCVVEFYRHLAKYTQVVLAVSKDNPANGEWGGQTFPILYHHNQGPANLLALLRLRKIVKTRQIDLFCIEHSYLGWMGILLRWFSGKPFVIRSHNIEAHRFRDMQKPWWLIYQWYEKQVHRQANHNFFITQEDKDWAVKQWGIAEARCTVITYGTDISGPIGTDEKLQARIQILKENRLHPSTRLFLFNGTLDYMPNTDALRIIVSELLPRLQQFSVPFCIFICGSRISRQWKDVLENTAGILYKGFVEDISFYLNGTDCFINPVTLGSGIKIKLADALAHDLPCISTRSGARGIDTAMTGYTLRLINDYDWQEFAKAMIVRADNTPPPMPESFYQFFNWDLIVQKALLSLHTV